MNNIFDETNKNSDFLPNEEEFERLFSESNNPQPPQREQNPPQQNGGNITLSMEQLLELMKTAAQSGNANVSSNSSTNQAEEAAKPSAPSSPTDPGTRVVFQSDEFEKKGLKKTPYANYDDDSFLDDENVSRKVISNAQSNASRGSYTFINTENDRFSISETEIKNSDLPSLSSAPRGTYVPRENTRAPFVLTSDQRNVSSGGFRLDEYEIADPNAAPSQNIPDEGENGEKKKLSGGEIARRIVLAVSIVAIVLSAAYLVREYILHKNNEKLESEISNLIVSVEETESTTEKKKKSSKEETTKKSESTTQKKKSIEEQWAEIKAEYPSIAFPTGLQLKYAKLYATNTNFAGYLEAEGINMSLPVVQTSEEDAENTYLKKNFYGAATKYGCPFVSSYNTIKKGELDYNTVIYGHHMNDRTIFGALDKYKTIDGFKACPVIKFNTLYEDHTWKVIAAFVTNDDPKDDGGYKFEYSFIDLSSDVYKQTYLNELMKRSIYDTGVDVDTSDKLLTLSTCSHEFTNARLVIVARLLRPGESEAVDVSLATNNESPRYPQAYYNAKKLDNPYKTDNNWYFE